MGEPAPAPEASPDAVFRRFDVRGPQRPTYVVWELTLACDQACTHCGSRAGAARPDELSTEQALAVVPQLAALGTFECVLIGGEAYLHPGFLAIVRALKAAGIRPTLTTGGRSVTAELATELAQAGLYSASVSVDGLERTHDLMRAGRGSFQAACAAIGHLRAAGLRVSANTNLNRLNEGDLEALAAHLVSLGIVAWQVQLTTPLGRGADRPGLVLQPYDLPALFPRVEALKRRLWAEHRVSLQPGNNLGYFGPEEAALRSPTPEGTDHFQGCQAGRQVMGLEADGGVKGCPSLQRAYVGGSVKDTPLAQLWHEAPQLAFTRARTVDDLWGFCRECPFAAQCLGGCSFTAHALLGRPGNNPYCHYRARAFARRGLRERLVQRAPAPGEPFDCARFEVVVESADAPEHRPPTPQALLRVVR